LGDNPISDDIAIDFARQFPKVTRVELKGTYISKAGAECIRLSYPTFVDVQF
jgi:hypothetical protein